jgi:hypothetical protein
MPLLRKLELEKSLFLVDFCTKNQIGDFKSMEFINIERSSMMFILKIDKK